jgi:hypothetical protein
LAGNGICWGIQLRIITYDASPSNAELSTANSTGYYHNYDIIKSNQIITYANYTTGCDDIEGEDKPTTYNRTIDVTTNNASYTTIGGLNGAILASIWVITKH